ncbi:MAG TPA: hypothetical protein VIK53_09420 [Verrucomicrobiae bacterium]
MKIKSSIAFGLAGLLMCLTVAFAADGIPPGKYSLSVARVYESNPSLPEWVFIFGGTNSVRGGETVCKSVASLKKLLAGLPRGSTLDWSPTCSGESEVLKGDIEDLKTICTKAGITFTIHPSG